MRTMNSVKVSCRHGRRINYIVKRHLPPFCGLACNQVSFLLDEESGEWEAVQLLWCLPGHALRPGSFQDLNRLNLWESKGTERC